MPQPTEWTDRDAALLHTCRVVAVLQERGDVTAFPEVVGPFPPARVDEQFLATGPFTVWSWTALGDGSWSVSTPSVAGTGTLGLGLAAGSILGGAIARRRARREAAAAAQPRWVPISHGALYVSQHGFYLHTPMLLTWHWDRITTADLLAPGAVHISGTSTDGPVTWLLHSNWAELVFVLWAMARHPRHPQLLTGWLPDGWAERARAMHQPVPPLAAAPRPQIE